MGNATQIATSVTILNSYLGFQAISLTNYETSALSAISQGSKIEVAGGFFNWTSDDTPNASSWTAIATAAAAYLQVTPSGSAGSQILTSAWTTTAPTWSVTQQGWYLSAASIVRVIGGAYKAGATSQEGKFLLGSKMGDNYSLGRLHHLPLGNTTDRTLSNAVPPASGAWTAAIQATGAVGIPNGAKGIRARVSIEGYATAAALCQFAVSLSDNNSSVPTGTTAHPSIRNDSRATADGIYGYIFEELDIPLNSSGQFYARTRLATNVTIASSNLVISAVGWYMGD